MFGSETAIVQSGNLVRFSGPRPSDGQFAAVRTWGLTDPDSLIGSTYANRTQFVYDLSSWENGGAAGNGFYLGLIGRNTNFRLLVVDNNVSSYSAFLTYTPASGNVFQIPLQSITPYPAGIAKKYELHLYDFTFESVVQGARRYSFEFKVLYDSLIVLESMTGTTRNQVRGMIDYIDWCLDPYSMVNGIVGTNPTGYIDLDEFSFQINGDDNCSPPTVPPV